MQHQEAIKDKLLIETELDIRIITEFIALCVDGWVEAGEIRGDVLNYRLEESGNLYNLLLQAEVGSKFEDDAAQELSNLIMGLHSLGASIRWEGDLFERHEDLREAQVWMARNSQDKPKLEHPIHAQSHLTLGDLSKINQYLIEQTEPITELERNADFRSTFPLVDLYNGSYGNIRHSSGHEINIKWINNRIAGSHKVDAPNPGAEAYKHFNCQRTGETYRRPKAAVNETGPYRKSAQNRRKLAYMLGSVPEGHKARVFAWVQDVLNSVDYYHETRGSIPLPELFSIDFAGCKMTATHDLVFRLEAKER